MISNDFDQSGVEMVGAKIGSFLNFSQELMHSKVKDTSLTKRLFKGLAILLRFAKVLAKPTIETSAS